MARLPHCASCSKCDIFQMKCHQYPIRIPDNILLEYESCEYFEKEKVSEIEEDDDLPLAKGR